MIWYKLLLVIWLTGHCLDGLDSPISQWFFQCLHWPDRSMFLLLSLSLEANPLLLISHLWSSNSSCLEIPPLFKHQSSLPIRPSLHQALVPSFYSYNIWFEKSKFLCWLYFLPPAFKWSAIKRLWAWLPNRPIILWFAYHPFLSK